MPNAKQAADAAKLRPRRRVRRRRRPRPRPSSPGVRKAANAEMFAGAVTSDAAEAAQTEADRRLRQDAEAAQDAADCSGRSRRAVGGGQRPPRMAASEARIAAQNAASMAVMNLAALIAADGAALRNRPMPRTPRTMLRTLLLRRRQRKRCDGGHYFGDAEAAREPPWRRRRLRGRRESDDCRREDGARRAAAAAKKAIADDAGWPKKRESWMRCQIAGAAQMLADDAKDAADTAARIAEANSGRKMPKRLRTRQKRRRRPDGCYSGGRSNDRSRCGNAQGDRHDGSGQLGNGEPQVVAAVVAAGEEVVDARTRHRRFNVGAPGG